MSSTITTTPGYTWVNGEVVTATKLNLGGTPTVAPGQSYTFADGTAAAPSVNFTTDNTAGIYYAPSFVGVAQGGLAALKVSSVASAVNEITITSNVTGDAPHIYATGTDASIGIHISPKGSTGRVNIQDGLDDTKRLRFDPSGSTTGAVLTLASVPTVARTLTLPDATDTLVGKATTDTLTNKSISLGSNTLTATSAQLATAVSDETGSGSLVFATSPTLVTPALGTPSALVGTNITGTAAGLTAGSVTTNANLTGAITSVGNAASLGSFTSASLAAALTDETGTGANVFANTPTLVTPVLGAATATSINGNTLTTGTYTLTGAAAKTLTFSNSLTLAGTDATTLTFPGTSATIARTDAAQSFTGIQTILGTSTLKFGATAQASVGVSADTTAGNLVLTAPSTGKVSLSSALQVLSTASGTPGITSNDDTSTGLRFGNSTFDTVIGGTSTVRWRSLGPRAGSNVQWTWASTTDPAATVSDTGIGRYAAGVATVTTGEGGGFGGLILQSTNTLKFGATAAATIGVSADTTAGDTIFTASTTGRNRFKSAGGYITVESTDGSENGGITFKTVGTSSRWSINSGNSTLDFSDYQGTSQLQLNAGASAVALWRIGGFKLGATAQASISVSADTTAGNLVLTPPGTGAVLVPGTSLLKFGATAAATIGVSADTTAGNLVLTPPSTGAVLVPATSLLKFGATAAATIGVSADTTAGVLTLTPPSAGTTLINLGNSSTISDVSGETKITASVAVELITSAANHRVQLYNGGFYPYATNVLTLGSSAGRWSQGFFGITGLSFGATAAATIGVSADTTNGNLDLTPPSSSGRVRLIGATNLQLTGASPVIASTTGYLLLSGATELYLDSTSTNHIFVRPGGSTMLDVSSTGVQMTGTNTLKFGATAAATIGVSADTTAGSLVLTCPATGTIKLVGAYQGSTSTRSGPGACDVVTETTKVTTTGVNDALTLANGVDGQIKRIVHDVDGGSFILTPTTATGWSTFTSTVVGESISLVFVTTRGWMVVGNRLGVIA